MSVFFCTFAPSMKNEMIFFTKWKEYFPYYKRNLKVAFPVMITQIGASLVGLIDSIMVGHYATADFAAVSFSNAIFFTVMVFAMGLLMGVTPLVGFEVGAGEKEEGRLKIEEGAESLRRQEIGKQRASVGERSAEKIQALFSNGFIMTIGVCVVMALLLGSVYPFLDRFGQEDVVVEAARRYYLYIVISIIPFLFFCFFKQFLEGLGNTLVAMILTLIANGLNVLLNWVFIFGHWGAEPMGATGAGLATLIARTILPIMVFAVILARKQWRLYVQKQGINDKEQNIGVIRKLLKVGTPIGIQTFLETFTFTMSFIFIGWLSKEALAAHQIANQIADLTFMLAIGIGSATTIRVSHQLGKGDLYAVRMASNASIHLVLLMNTFGAALMISLRHYIPYIFTKDTEVIAIASQLILFAGLFQYADGLQTVGAAMLRGITDVKKPMFYAFVAYILIALPIGLICMFPLGLGANGMWIGFIFGLSVAAILFHTRFRKWLRLRDGSMKA